MFRVSKVGFQRVRSLKLVVALGLESWESEADVRSGYWRVVVRNWWRCPGAGEFRSSKLVTISGPGVPGISNLGVGSWESEVGES